MSNVIYPIAKFDRTCVIPHRLIHTKHFNLLQTLSLPVAYNKHSDQYLLLTAVRLVRGLALVLPRLRKFCLFNFCVCSNAKNTCNTMLHDYQPVFVKIACAPADWTGEIDYTEIKPNECVFIYRTYHIIIVSWRFTILS